MTFYLFMTFVSLFYLNSYINILFIIQVHHWHSLVKILDNQDLSAFFIFSVYQIFIVFL